jgi:hypothetical protein
MERRLAAILAADVVGYSRLMEVDEAGTLSVLKSHRKNLIDPEIAKHSGRVVKLMGDGALVEFASVIDAVECAAAIQQSMNERNAELSEDRRIEFRIGINIGDIIVEGEDIYGDGVNVAARLEGLADPGSICVSRNVFAINSSRTSRNRFMPIVCYWRSHHQMLRRFHCRISHQSQYCPSITCPVIRSRSILVTESPKTSSRLSPNCAGFLSSHAIRHSFTRGGPST